LEIDKAMEKFRGRGARDAGAEVVGCGSERAVSIKVDMKIIGIEEHFLTREIRIAWSASAIGTEGTGAFDMGEIEKRLEDLGDGRIALMDEAGVAVQVLSVTTPQLHNLGPADALRVAQRTNELVSATIARHPTRFEGFATLPMPAPREAAKELELCLTQFGFMGTMVCGRTRDKNLDHADFLPVLEMAAARRAPIFIHPQVPQKPVRDALYSGFGEQVDAAFSAFGLGWHYEAGIQFVRLILSGAFDRWPELQIILGHWGEVVLFYLQRLGALARVTKLERPIAEYFRENLYVTASGMWSAEYMRRAVEVVGHERILFSMDYPYQYRPGGLGREFVEECGLSAEQKELFAHGNWERLTGGILRG
jgi:uncharacterized protein